MVAKVYLLVHPLDPLLYQYLETLLHLVRLWLLPVPIYPLELLALEDLYFLLLEKLELFLVLDDFP